MSGKALGQGVSHKPPGHLDLLGHKAPEGPLSSRVSGKGPRSPLNRGWQCGSVGWVREAGQIWVSIWALLGDRDQSFLIHGHQFPHLSFPRLGVAMTAV